MGRRGELVLVRDIRGSSPLLLFTPVFCCYSGTAAPTSTALPAASVLFDSTGPASTSIWKPTHQSWKVATVFVATVAEANSEEGRKARCTGRVWFWPKWPFINYARAKALTLFCVTHI